MHLPGPEEILDDTEHRDIVIAVLNALDSRVEAKLRATSLIETGLNAITGEDAGKWVGCLLGLAMRICDDNPTTHHTIDQFRQAVREAATKG